MTHVCVKHACREIRASYSALEEIRLVHNIHAGHRRLRVANQITLTTLRLITFCPIATENDKIATGVYNALFSLRHKPNK